VLDGGGDVSALPAGLSLGTTRGSDTAIFHDGTGRWLPIDFGDDERLVPLIVPHLQGVDWTVNPDEVRGADREAWLAGARAATQAADAAVQPIVTRWHHARDEATWQACDDRYLCRACAESYGDDVDAHLDECDGREALDAEMIEAKLGLTPPERKIPEQAATS
jgi:hypothetical protein